MTENNLFEEFYYKYKDHFENLDDDFKQKFIKPNIILSGKTGVGKSTLINAIFGFDYAETGIGKPVSQALREYSAPGVNVNLFDTKGLELDSTEREVSRTSIIEEIKRRAKSSTEEDHMHVMWYCISNESKRIEDTEIAWIRDFSKYMPVIIVLTQTLDTDEELKDYLETELTGVVICQVLAKDRNIIGHVIPAHGLKVLINETLKILPEATQRAFTAAQKIKIEEKIKSARQFIQERLDSKGPFNYKNLGHIADTLPIGLDFIGKGAVYLYIAKDIMTLMGIPVDKNFLKFSKQAKPLIKSIILPFVFFEGTKTVGKAAAKYGSEKIGPKTLTYLSKLLGKSAGKGNIFISPVVGLILGTFNRGTADKTRILYAKTFFGYENPNFSTLSRKIRVFLYPKWT